ncbi:zonadhesin-like isoform X2 [Mytilus trossulus]|uniref:zonadhesin-like isoform X2 n=1 Tax=Mytilus trossulus TaxID=6551 RepID=UPI0030064BBB
MRNIVLQFMLSFLMLETLQVFGQKCTTLENPAHGRVRLRARGRIAKFRCYRKYKLFGAKIIICSNDKWSLPPPICIRKGCDDIQSSENLTVTQDQGGAVLEFKCAPPLKLSGEKLITCDGNTWSAPVPSCEYVEPGNYCDFEDENICGWQHDKLANFEWKWNSGTTPTRRTGPKYDHTLGKGGNGHYMFMESSSPIKINDKSRLLSPYYPATTGGLCFEIWYHMWGVAGYNQVGRLKIYIGEMGQTDTLSQKAEFDVSGNQGDEWIKAQFPIGEQKESFRFIIEGMKLKSYLSDISVDDPKLYNCSDDFEDTTISYQETTAAETTEAVVQTTSPLIRTTPHQESMTTQPVTTTDEFIDLSTNVYSSSIVQNIDSSTELKTKAITTTTMLPTTSKVVETTIKNHITTSPVNQSKTGMTSEPMTSKEVITKPLTTMKKTTIKQTMPTTRDTTVSSTSASTTKEITTTITTSTKRKTKITSKPTTVTTSTTRKPETTFVVTTIKPTTTTTKSLPTTTKKTKPTNKKTKPTTVKTSTTAILSTATTKQTTNIPVFKTTKRVYISSKSVSTALTTQEMVSSDKKSEIYFKNTTASSVSNLTTTQGSVDIVEPAKRSDNTPIKPLMIGIGVGIAIGLIIVIGVIYTYLKKRRKDDIFEDEMEPIAKNAVYD